MTEMGVNHPNKYSPEAGSGLRDRIRGVEKHSPYVLFNYAWANMSNLDYNLQLVLVNRLEKDDEFVIDAIEEAIELEREKGKNAAKVYLENKLFEILATNSDDPEI